MLRFIAWCYASVVFVATCFAWCTDFALRNDPREHLLPDALLDLTTMPLSLIMNVLYPLAPNLFDRPFVQLASLSIFGVMQAALLFWLAGWATTSAVRAPNSRIERSPEE